MVGGLLFFAEGGYDRELSRRESRSRSFLRLAEIPKANPIKLKAKHLPYNLTANEMQTLFTPADIPRSEFSVPEFPG